MKRNNNFIYVCYIVGENHIGTSKVGNYSRFVIKIFFYFCTIEIVRRAIIRERANKKELLIKIEAKRIESYNFTGSNREHQLHSQYWKNQQTDSTKIILHFWLHRYYFRLL